MSKHNTTFQQLIVVTKQVVIAAGLCVAWLAVSPAHAHFVWVERDETGPARMYFGEWANDLREKSGGRLDMFKAPQAFGTSASQPLQFARRDDHLEIAVNSPGDVRVVETGLAPREDKQNGGKTKTVFCARAGREDTTAKLDLEFIPTTANGSTFVLMFRGAPLAKTDITVFGPPKWEKPLRTDDQGRVTTPTPWVGRYILNAVFTEQVAGTGDSGAFDRTRYVTTLSFVNSNGYRSAGESTP
jgi:hypothetical protein